MGCTLTHRSTQAVRSRGVEELHCRSAPHLGSEQASWRAVQACGIYAGAAAAVAARAGMGFFSKSILFWCVKHRDNVLCCMVLCC